MLFHHLKCMAARGAINRRHTILKHVLKTILRAAGACVQVEEQISVDLKFPRLRPERPERRCDLIARFGSVVAVIDVKGFHPVPANEVGLRSLCSEPFGKPCQKVERKTISDYNDDYVISGSAVIPFVMDAYGRIGKIGWKLLEDAAGYGESIGVLPDAGRFLSQAVKRLSIALQSGNQSVVAECLRSFDGTRADPDPEVTALQAELEGFE